MKNLHLDRMTDKQLDSLSHAELCEQLYVTAMENDLSNFNIALAHFLPESDFGMYETIGMLVQILLALIGLYVPPETQQALLRDIVTDFVRFARSLPEFGEELREKELREMELN